MEYVPKDKETLETYTGTNTGLSATEYSRQCDSRRPQNEEMKMWIMWSEVT